MSFLILEEIPVDNESFMNFSMSGKVFQMNTGMNLDMKRVFISCLCLTPLLITSLGCQNVRSSSTPGPVEFSKADLQQATPGKAIIRAIRGKAEYQAGVGNWQKLNFEQVLRSGDTVKTVGDSQVDFYLGQNGPVVRLTRNSELKIVSLRLSKDETPESGCQIETHLELKRGRALLHVGNLSAGSIYQIKTLKGIYEVSSAESILNAKGQLRVISGEVVYRKAGLTRRISQGHVFESDSGEVKPATGELMPLVVLPESN
jgi:hypothetical protein